MRILRPLLSSFAIACPRGLAPEKCVASCQQAAAIHERSKSAFAAAQEDTTTFNSSIRPPSNLNLDLTDYLDSDWYSFLRTRGFLDSSTQQHSVAEHVISASFSHPLTLAHAIAQAINLACDGGTDVDRLQQVKADMVSHENGKVNICILGARAEADVPLAGWNELALACHNLLDASGIVVSFCGPALRPNSSSPRHDASGPPTSSTEIIPIHKHATAPIIGDGPNGNQISVALRHFSGFYHDFCHKPIADAHNSTRPLGDSTTLFCLLNPGVAHPAWNESWEPTLKLLTDSGSGAPQPRKTVVMTSYDHTDDSNDRECAAAYFGHPLHSGTGTTHSAAVQINPFRNLKFDSLYDRSALPTDQSEGSLREVQSNWSVRVYLPQSNID